MRFACGALVCAMAGMAQQPDLTSLSLEEFMNLKVSSVSRSSRSLARSAAAVYVITQEDIRRSGAKILPDALRLAPGVHVAQVSGMSWAISIRGFSAINSDKLLVMIDGRTIYNALLSGVIWSANLIDLEDVDRIEVIRGPGAVWGANAVTGVINIITSHTRTTQGGLVSMSSGNTDPGRAMFRYGGTAGRNTGYRVWGQSLVLGQPGIEAGDGRAGYYTTARAGIRVDRQLASGDTLRIEGEAQGGTGPQTYADPFKGFQRDRSYAMGGYVLGHWHHNGRDGSVTSAQASFSSSLLESGFFRGSTSTLDVEVNSVRPWRPHHEVVIGAGARLSLIGTSGSRTMAFEPTGRNYGMGSLLLLDRWSFLEDRLALESGARFETYTMAGPQAMPTARVIWNAAPKRSYWMSISRATRVPAHADYALRLPLSVPGTPLIALISGSDQFRPETMTAVETGFRLQPRRWWWVDVSLFRHAYDHLECFTAAGTTTFLGLPMLGLRTINGRTGVNEGGEAVTHVEVNRRWAITASWSYLNQQSFPKGSSPADSFMLETRAPGNQALLRSAWDWRGWSVDAVFRYAQGSENTGLPQVVQADANISRKWGEFVEVGLSGRNLLRPWQREFTGQILYGAGYVRRSLDLNVRWRF